MGARDRAAQALRLLDREHWRVLHRRGGDTQLLQPGKQRGALGIHCVRRGLRLRGSPLTGAGGGRRRTQAGRIDSPGAIHYKANDHPET